MLNNKNIKIAKLIIIKFQKYFYSHSLLWSLSTHLNFWHVRCHKKNSNFFWRRYFRTYDKSAVRCHVHSVSYIKDKNFSMSNMSQFHFFLQKFISFDILQIEINIFMFYYTFCIPTWYIFTLLHYNKIHKKNSYI